MQWYEMHMARVLHLITYRLFTLQHVDVTGLDLPHNILRLNSNVSNLHPILPFFCFPELLQCKQNLSVVGESCVLCMF